MKKLLPLIILLGLDQLSGFSQNLDSLWGVWEDERQPDTARLEAVDDLIWKHYMDHSVDSALALATEYRSFAEQNGLAIYEAEAINAQGVARERMGDFSGSLKDYQLSLSKFRELGLPKREANLLRNTGFAYRNLNNDSLAVVSFIKAYDLFVELELYNRAVQMMNEAGWVERKQGNLARSAEYHTKALQLAEESGNEVGIGYALQNLAYVSLDVQGYDKGIEYAKRAVEVRRKLGRKVEEAYSMSILGTLYYLKGDHEVALSSYNKALAIMRANENKGGIAQCLNDIGNLFESKKEYKEAIDHYQESFELYEQLKDTRGMSLTLNGIGGCLYFLSRFKESVQYTERAMSYAKVTDRVNRVRDSAMVLYRSYKGLGQHEKALDMYELYIETRDSLTREENQREVLRQEYKYEYEKVALADSLEFAKKEAVMLERTEKQQLGLFAAGGGLLLLLALAFTIYSGKKKSDELLLNILPYETAQELKEKGSTEAKLIDNVTVLFTDFKGFTAMSEQLSPKELVEDLNVCFSEFDRIMERHGIEKIKTIGDAYMAAGGLPTPNTTHAYDVTSAALEMIKVVEEGKMKKMQAGLPYFEVRIGIHTGPVVSGIVGVKKFQYDIWGDTVNTASRMESSGEVGKVNISETTYELVKDQFTCEFRGEVEAKGKGKLKMYFVSKNG